MTERPPKSRKEFSAKVAAERKARRAAALRENLQRRKHQDRSREIDASPAIPSEASPKQD